MANLGISDLSGGEMIGSGGSAAVFAATDKNGTGVAVKLFRLSTGQASEKQFEREVTALERLSDHSAVLPILSSGKNDRGELFVVMPLMTCSVQEVLDSNGPLRWDEALSLLLVVCDAIDFAHSREVLHRDIKPGNILLDAQGQPFVADFGIAKLTDATEGISSTIQVTTAFAPPEIFRGENATVQTDVYSLAATYVSLVTGEPPFPLIGVDTPEARILRVLEDAPIDLKGVVPHMPGKLAVEISRALSKDPSERHVSVAEFRVSLQRASGRPVNKRPTIDPLPTSLRSAASGGGEQAAAGSTGRGLGSLSISFMAASAVLLCGLLILVWLLARDSPDGVVQSAATETTQDNPQVLPSAPRSVAKPASETTTSITTASTATTDAGPVTSPLDPEDVRIHAFADDVELGFLETWVEDMLGAPEIGGELDDGKRISIYLGEQSAAVVISDQVVTAWGVVTCAERPGATVNGIQLGQTTLSDTSSNLFVDYNLQPQFNGERYGYLAHWGGGASSADGGVFSLSGSNYRCVHPVDAGAKDANCVSDDYVKASGEQPFYVGQAGAETFPVQGSSCFVNMVGEVSPTSRSTNSIIEDPDFLSSSEQLLKRITSAELVPEGFPVEANVLLAALDAAPMNFESTSIASRVEPADETIYDFASTVDLQFSQAWADKALGPAEMSEQVDGKLVSTYLGTGAAAVVISAEDAIIAWGVVSCASRSSDPRVEFNLSPLQPLIENLTLTSTPLSAPVSDWLSQWFDEATYNLSPQGSGQFGMYFVHWWGAQVRAADTQFTLVGANYRCSGEPNNCGGSVDPGYTGDTFYTGPIDGAPFPVDLDSCTINMIGRVSADLSMNRSEIETIREILLNRLDFVPDRL